MAKVVQKVKEAITPKPKKVVVEEVVEEVPHPNELKAQKLAEKFASMLAKG